MEEVQVNLEERDPLATDDEYVDSCLTGDNLFCCQVCNMLLIGFSKYTDREKAEIINAGRPKPKMSALVLTTIKGHKRHFNPETYNSYEWLTGCERRAKFYCWACLLFSNRSNLWRTTGMSDLNNLHTAMKRHASCQVHIESMLKLKTYGKIGPNVDETAEAVQRTKRNMEEEVIKNKEVLKKLIRLVCFLSNHELSPGGLGGVDPTDPIDKNKYVDFVNFMTKFDDTLKNKIKGSDKFFNSSVRNNIIFAINSVLYKKIKEEIAESNFVAIIVDEVSELAETILISTMVRFTTRSGHIRERFLNFQEVPSVRRAEPLFEVISSKVNFLDCHSKVVAQCYDGGVVRSNELFQLQAKVKEICPNALILHCVEHKLSSVLAQSLSTIKECKHFFFTVNSLSSNFLKSKRLRDELNISIRRMKPDTSNFEWSFNGSFLKNIIEIRQPLIELFENISKSEDTWDFETVFFSAGFLVILSSDVSFNMLLLFLSEVLFLADKLSEDFKGVFSNVDICVQKVRDFISFLKNKTDSFYLLYEETLHLIEDAEPPKKKIKTEETTFESPSQSYKSLYESVLLNIVAQLNYRFSDMSRLNFLALTEFKSIEGVRAFHEGLLCSLKNTSFDVSALCAELNVLIESEVVKKSSAGSMLKYLRQMNLESTLPQTVKFCELAVTLPVLNGTSTYSGIKNYISSSSIGHKLSLLPLLSIEKDMLNKLLEQSQFYEEVIEEFAKKEPSIPLCIVN